MPETHKHRRHSERRRRASARARERRVEAAYANPLPGNSKVEITRTDKTMLFSGLALAVVGLFASGIFADNDAWVLGCLGTMAIGLLLTLPAVGKWSLTSNSKDKDSA